MLCVPPPRAGAEQPAERTGAAPALSIALEQLPASPSQVQREHGKNFQEIKDFWLGKELVQLKKKIIGKQRKYKVFFIP